MEDPVGNDLHAARVLLSEQNVVDTRRFGIAKRIVMRGSRMFTHRLVAASTHLADAVQAADEGRRAAFVELQSDLSAAREESGALRKSLDRMAERAEQGKHRESQHHEQLAAEIHALTEQLTAAKASVAILDTAVASIQSQLTSAERAVSHHRSELKRIRTQMARQSRIAPEVSKTEPGFAPTPPEEWTADALDEQGYLAFEERFRGSKEEIRERQLDSLHFVEDLKSGRAPLLDIACGRGEWLDILRSEGIEAYGVDNNSAMIADAVANGLDVRHGDALQHLSSLKESSLQGISAFHFVEHIPMRVLVRMLDDALVALEPGGVLLLETPNPTNVAVGAASFYLDPTHVRPIHPEFLRFLVESRGFDDVQIHFVHPVIPAETLVAAGPDEGYLDERINRVVGTVESVIYGPQDYALTARRPALS